MPNAIETLEERGFIEALSTDELKTIANQPLKVYCGFDPTADSLHLGHLVALMGLAWFQRFGHSPVALVGGATGMIGDPSGKASERQLLDAAAIERNVAGITRNLEAVLDSTKERAILNNYDWFKAFSFIDFLRDVGKSFRIGPMLGKESVRLRMESEEGMSFTEFSYQLLQAYDFLYLYRNHGVSLQMGGSDQWGNITAGIELVRKECGKSVYGLTFPLLTRSDGQKFGKTEEGAVWLSAERCKPFEFYQYLYRVPDADVIKLMRLLTFMEMDEIRKYEAMMQQSDYVPNTAQKRLAEEVTRIVHGEENLKVALKVTEGIAPGAETALNAETLEALAENMPSHTVSKDDLIDVKLIDFVAAKGLMKSKGDVRRMIKNGGLYLNNRQIEDENCLLRESDLVDGRLLLLAFGKKNKTIIRVHP